MTSATTKIVTAVFTTIAITFGVCSGVYRSQVETDRNARWHALFDRCNKAYASNERVAQVDEACKEDAPLRHYDDVDFFLLLACMASGMIALGGFYQMSWTEPEPASDASN